MSGHLATRIALACAVGAAALWALGGVFAVPGFDRGINPSAMASARVMLSALILLLIMALFRRDLLKLPRKAFIAVVCYGVSMAAVNYTYYFSIDRIPVGVTLALQFTAPAMILVINRVVRGIKHPFTVWLAAALTLFGAVVTGGALSSGDNLDTAGVVSALLAAVSLCAIYIASESVGKHQINPVTTVFYGFVVATITWSFVFPWWNWPVDALSNSAAVWSVIGVTIAGTLVPFFLAAWAARVISSSTVGIATSIEPAFGALFAWLILNQRLTTSQIVGGAIIVAGVILVERSSSTPYAEEPTSPDGTT